MNIPKGRGLLTLLLASLLCLPAAAATTRVLTLDDVRARFGDAASRFADVDGINLHYRDEGSGPVVVLIHGTYGDLQDWNGWARVLTPKYRVVRFDLPGAGLTGPVPNGNYSADRMLRLIDALTDQLGIERFAIGGVSYGGLLAFRYAATRSDRVTTLVLANSAGIEFGGRGGTGSQSTAAQGYNIMTDDSVTRPDVEKFFHYVVNDPARVTDALLERKLAFQNIAGRAQENAAGTRLYERGNPQRVLAHVHAPALVLWGSGNKALSNETADAFVAALKNARVVERQLFADAGHLINLDRPDETATAVMRFLDKYNSWPVCGQSATAPKR